MKRYWLSRGKYLVIQFNYRIVAQVPSTALGKTYRSPEAFVGSRERGSHLIYAAIVENILVAAVYDWYPHFSVNNETRANHYICCKRNLVPRARCRAVSSITFMLQQKESLAYEPVFDKQRFCKTDAGVEIKVCHRHGFLKNIPETLLAVKEKRYECQGITVFVRRWAMDI